ncbi:MAG: hypothetical protein A4E72_00492 [Syntrophus sp. PtaU1.Bin208]|nr:MAG: hypothetical protein A4E72_00492 [Syntrophus sp. PtaU1.Bin208]
MPPPNVLRNGQEMVALIPLARKGKSVPSQKKRNTGVVKINKILLLFPLLFFISCGSTDLSQIEAKKILEEQIKPRPIYVHLKSSDPRSPETDQEILRLRSRHAGSTGSCPGAGKFYNPSEEGEKYFREIYCYGNRCGGYMTIGYKRIKEVTEVLNNRSNDSAVVKYLLIFEPLEPFYSELCAGGKCDRYTRVLEKPVKAQFKRYDKGWRMKELPSCCG